MEGTAIAILDGRRIMALSTVRPDGWPQTTIVGYANIGLLLYFVISRSSQKFANLQQDNRVSIAVGEEPSHLGLSQAVYSSAYAVEAVDAAERETKPEAIAEAVLAGARTTPLNAYKTVLTKRTLDAVIREARA